MTGKGRISITPNRRFRLMLGAHALWLVTLFALAAWWGRLLTRQAARIAELEAQVGVSAGAAREHWARTSRMMFWESATFFALLIAASGLLAWLTWREAKRARSLQAFFASVTHELRTPLTSIRLQAESIQEQLTDAANSPLARRLLEDTNRLESQVERTLELARVEGGGLVLNRSLPLKPWLEYFLRHWSEGRSTALCVEADVMGCEIQADPSAVQIILKNLLENSIRHAGRDGDPKITLSAEQSEGWVVLRYRDDGAGFDGDVRKLGRLFQKGASSTGAGVGLYLVSILMRRMGGRAEFSVTSGLETALWFRPGEEQTAESAPEQEEHERAVGGAHV